MRQRIVILGGGVGAMTSAFELTNRPGWRDKYEITVYQLGWRLGGKGASGRNLEVSSRIEEHGLHVWLGFYDNAFRLIQQCYRELDRPRGAPLARWEDAFKPQNLIVFEEQVNGRWIHWPLEFEGNDMVPGHDAEPPTPWEYVPMMLDLMRQVFVQSPQAGDGADGLAETPPWWERVLDTIGTGLDAARLNSVGFLLEGAVLLASSLDKNPRRHSAGDQQAIPWMLEKFLQWLWRSVERQIESDEVARRLWIALDLGAAIVSGMIRDGVIYHGFDFIDDLDLKDWLRSHGASKLSLESAPVRAGYDLVFGFRNGDRKEPSLAAGAGLRGALRLYFGYRGAVAWEMQAGMGDAIFAPLYQVLKRRGVKFEFFHRVKNLRLASDKESIAGIELGRQVNLKGGKYDPLVTVKKLPCWPSEPLYDQIVEGETLKKDGINLESSWTTWKDVAEIDLKKGVDFHVVVLGISLGALPYVCGELLVASERWRAMVKHVETTRTQAFQLWMKPSLKALGWSTPKPVLGSYVEPLDTWADMSHLIDCESWPKAHRPGSIAYFCGPLKDGEEPAFGSAPDFPRREAERVKAGVIEFVENHLQHLWPKSVQAGSRRLDWELLIDPAGKAGLERFDSQYWRANIDPSERYVLSVPGSTKHRLKSDASGFQNLYLAGDWTLNGLSAGCVEAATISGMQVSRAISGSPEVITGETDRVQPDSALDSLSERLWSLWNEGLRFLRWGAGTLLGASR